MVRVRSALKLHGTRVDEGVLSRWSMNEGSWVDYQHAAWTLFMDGLLERLNKLLKQACRELVKPFRSDWQGVENGLCSSVTGALSHLGKMRDPIAHGGGPIGALAEERLLEMTVVLGVWYDPLYLLEKQRDSQAKWQGRMHEATLLVFAQIERSLEELNQAVPWEDVQRKWC